MCNGSGSCGAQGTQVCSYRCNVQGTDCDNTNYCSPNPCQNGGTCANTASTYSCSCAGGYYGTNCEDAHFEWLGVNYCYVRGISADGSTVVGSIQNGAGVDVPAYSKTAGAKPNWVTLTYASGTIDQGSAWAANTDGSVIVGQANIVGSGGAFRWTAATGVVPLGYDASSLATGVTANGTTVVGRKYGADSTDHAFRWQSGTTTDLGSLGTNDAVAGVSGDGSVIAGGMVTSTSGGAEVPFRWTQNTGFVRLGTDTGGNATAISLDGNTIVGNMNGVFRFVNNVGYSLMSLGTLTGASVRAVSGDGSVMGGLSDQGTWLWDATNGARVLPAVLTGFGVDMSGWSAMDVRAISSDGKVLAGSGYRSGTFTCWIARL